MAVFAEGFSAVHDGAEQVFAWRDSALWAQFVAVFVIEAREAEGREAAPTAVVVDSQSVKTTEPAVHAISTQARRSWAASAI